MSSARWLMTSLAAALLVLFVFAGQVEAGSAQVVTRGPQEGKQIALTFDDNNMVARSLATLQVLRKYRVPATLFVGGAAVKNSPSINEEILRGMAEGLFEVGDHTWSHPVLTKLSGSALVREIGGGTDAFRQVTGARTVPLFRPPYGETNSRVAAVAGEEGFLYLVLWDVDPRDWAGGSASSIASHVLRRARAGSIVLFHLSAAHTAEALPTIIEGLRAKGYELVTVSTLLKGDRQFLDVEGSSQAGQSVARVVERGLMSGYDADYFGPEDGLTRAQLAKVAVLAAGLHTSEVEKASSPTFADVPPVADRCGRVLSYPFDYVEEAAAAGLVAGSPGPAGQVLFRPAEYVTRLQLAQILARMLWHDSGDSWGAEFPGSEESSGEAELSSSLIGSAIGASSPVFSDVPAYAAAEVTLVVSRGIMCGYADGKFRPWAQATRLQTAEVMDRYLDLLGAPGPAGL